MKMLVSLGCVLLFAASYAATTFVTKPAGGALGPAADEIDYVGQLPNPVDLVNNAADGAKVSKIIQTKGDVTVTYALAKERSRVVSYRLLANVGLPAEEVSAWAAVVASAPAIPVSIAASTSEVTPAPVAAPAPAPALVYNDYSPTTTIVNQPPAPVYSDEAPPAVYSQPAPPVPAYYDASPDYPAVYQPAVPAYYYAPAYSYYRSAPRVFPRETFPRETFPREVFPRSVSRETFPSGPREGFSGNRRR